MIIYLSGPMTGLPDFNFPAFTAATTTLRARGYAVISPHECPLGDGHDWIDYMRSDITELVKAEGVATLEGWWRSRGARIEVSLAADLGFPIRTVADWLERPIQEAGR